MNDGQDYHRTSLRLKTCFDTHSHDPAGRNNLLTLTHRRTEGFTHRRTEGYGVRVRLTFREQATGGSILLSKQP